MPSLRAASILSWLSLQKLMITLWCLIKKLIIMVPAYSLVVDIVAKGISIEEREFRASVSPCLTYLDALKGAFDKKPASSTFYQDENSKEWSLRCALMISVGQERGIYLADLFEAIVKLIAFELPDYEVSGESAKLNFS